MSNGENWLELFASISRFFATLHELRGIHNSTVPTDMSDIDKEIVLMKLDLMDASFILFASLEKINAGVFATAYQQLLTEMLEHYSFLQMLDIFSFCNFENDKGEREEDSYNSCKGIAIFLYSLLVMNAAEHFSVCVISPQFILNTILQHLPSLLMSSSVLEIDAGLKLLSKGLSLCSDTITESETNVRVVTDALCNVMIWCDCKVVRESALCNFGALLQVVPPERQYCIIIDTYKNNMHSSLRAYLVQTLKDLFLTTALGQQTQIFENTLEFIFEYLRIEDNLSLIKQSEEIIAILNFIRFITVKKDFPESVNRTIRNRNVELVQCVRDVTKSVESAKRECGYLIDACRSMGDISDWIERLPIDHILLGVPQDEQEKVLHIARCRLDLIKSLVDRVQELFENSN